jgi:hypothetical protein
MSPNSERNDTINDDQAVMIPTTTTTPIEDQILDIAIKASKRAGEIIRTYSAGVEVQERKSNTRDLLTKFDVLCEKVRGEYFVCVFIIVWPIFF